MPSEHASNITVRSDIAYRKLVDANQLRIAAEQTLLHQHAASDAALTVVITGNEQIQALNQHYRGLDAPTDVLAFAANEATQGPFVRAPDVPPYLGDVIISYPRAQAQAQAGEHPISAELQLLVVHGVLHLLGHDPATSTQKRAMWAAQAEILEYIGAPVANPA